MQIVIDIPDNMQEMCRWHQSCVCNLTSLEVDILAEAIRNGTVLPKGHGRLIDADKFISALFVYGQADDKFKLGELIKYTPSEIWEIEKILAKTVIEADADKEE
jgi:hypothetical protein